MEKNKKYRSSTVQMKKISETVRIFKFKKKFSTNFYL